MKRQKAGNTIVTKTPSDDYKDHIELKTEQTKITERLVFQNFPKE